MGTLTGLNIAIDLPAGWEGRIKQRERALAAAASATSPSASTTGALVQAANFALPPETGDFGSGAVEVMTNPDLLVVLFEYDRESASTPLFAAHGVPRLRPDDFSPVALQRVLDGQGGTQKFFNQAGRALCLYVVLGSHLRRVRTVPVLNELLSTLRVS